MESVSLGVCVCVFFIDNMLHHKVILHVPVCVCVCVCVCVFATTLSVLFF
jgi:hypothetical protein